MIFHIFTCISQQCWAQNVAHVWPPCYDVLRSRNRVTNARNILHQIMMRYVALKMLRSFGRGFSEAVYDVCRLQTAEVPFPFRNLSASQANLIAIQASWSDI